ncbi:efflux transporter outer membrane subunit [Massilia sp. BJB1822]|uniref:efflux transporter outer membrane subunit n=1 Tax=Massilia sp. BJB1822 TaxID=2744470 RepID=UPI001594AAD9|nr:efflux transporter outer membrane subunit [Massilia sp. BJB1822]NVD99195.1 efflux transporter outer membrane subunit [Massilia sp. BJB1822]
MKLSATLPGLLAGLLLAGCASDGGLAARQIPAPLASLPLGTAASAPLGDWPVLDWWRAFGDPQLDHLIEQARANAPSLAEARARIERADALLLARRADAGFAADASAALLRQRYSEHAAVAPTIAGSSHTSGSLTLGFRYEFDFWGQNRERIAAELAQGDAARIEARAAEAALASAIAHSYVELARTEQELLLASRAVALGQREVLLRQTRLRSGLDTEVEWRQASAEVPLAEAEATRLGAQAAMLRHQLAALAGAGPAFGAQIAAPQLQLKQGPALPPQLEADLVARRPEIVAQRLRLEAAGHAVAAARADFYPNINLSGSAGLGALDASQLLQGGSRLFGVGPALHLPLFDAGRLRAGLATRQAEQAAEVARYNQLVLNAFREVADQVSAWRALDSRVAAHASAARELDGAERAAEQRYRQGLSSQLLLLQVQRRQLFQQQADAALQAARLQTAIRLNHALGAGVSLNRS